MVAVNKTSTAASGNSNEDIIKAAKAKEAQDNAEAKKKAQTARNVGKGVESAGKVTGAILGAAGYSSAGNMVTEASGYAGDAANLSAGAYETAETGDASALASAVSSAATSTVTAQLDSQPSAFSSEGKAAAHMEDAAKADRKFLNAADKARKLRESENFEPTNRHARLTQKAKDQHGKVADYRAKAAKLRQGADSNIR